MGHNIDLMWLLELPDYVRCPNCKELTKSNFDEYDIDCGDPNAKDGVMSLDIQCDHCEEDFVYLVKLELPKEEDKK